MNSAASNILAGLLLITGGLMLLVGIFFKLTLLAVISLLPILVSVIIYTVICCKTELSLKDSVVYME